MDFWVNSCGFGVVWEPRVCGWCLGWTRVWVSVWNQDQEGFESMGGFVVIVGLCRGWWMGVWFCDFGWTCVCIVMNSGLCCDYPVCGLCQWLSLCFWNWWWKRVVMCCSAAFPKRVVCVIVGLFQLFAEMGVWLYPFVWLYQWECKCVCVRVMARLWRCEIGIIVNLSV